MKSTQIQMVLTDVDGVLTNGGFGYDGHEVYGPTGYAHNPIITFNTKDGAAFRRIMKAGVFCGVITTNTTLSVQRRLSDLRLPIVHTGVKDKLSVFKQICYKHKVHPENVVYIGDDFNDLPVLQEVGYGFMPSDAHPFLLDYISGTRTEILSKKGGEGILQEIEHMFFLRTFNIRKEYLERNGCSIEPFDTDESYVRMGLMIVLTAPTGLGGSGKMETNFIQTYAEDPPETIDIIEIINGYFDSIFEDEWMAQIPEEYREAVIGPYHWGIPTKIIYLLPWYESRWTPTAYNRGNRNGSEDHGIMQINTNSMPILTEKYWEGWKGEFDPWNPDHAIFLGFKYLRALYDETGIWFKAVAAYNCGLYRVLTNQVPASTWRYATFITEGI